MTKEEIIQMLKNNPIKIIKCGDIEIPVEYLKQTTVAVNGEDYIRLQRENKQLKDNWNKLKRAAKNHSDIKKKCYNGGLWFEIDDLLNKMIELEQGSDNK